MMSDRPALGKRVTDEGVREAGAPLPPVDVAFPVTALASDSRGLWAGGAGGVAWASADGAWQPRISGLPLTAIGALASAGGWLFAGGAEGIARSRDGGLSWEMVEAGGAVAPVAAFAASPRFEQDTTILAATIGGGILRSDDAGKNWEPASFGLHDREVTALAWGTGELVLAGTADGIYRSSNGGRAWRATSGSEGVAIACLTAMQDGCAVAVAEDGLVLRCTGDGARWTADEVLPEGIVATAIAAAEGHTLVLATASHGVLRSRDDGTTWAEAAPGAALALAGYGATLHAGMTTGVIRTRDSGATWNPLPAPPIHDLRWLLPIEGTVLLAGRLSGVVRWDSAHGWERIDEMPSPLTALQLAPAGRVWAAGPAGLARSDDGGVSWTMALTDEDQGEGAPAHRYIAHLTFGADGIGWAGSADGSRLLRTGDGGASWEPHEAPFGVLPLAALQLAGKHGQLTPVLMAATYHPRLQMAQLWRTLDDGVNWQRGAQVRTGWPIVATWHAPPLLALGSSVFVERADGSWAQTSIGQGFGVRRVAGNEQMLLALTTGGLFRSDDQGSTWTRDDAGVPIEQAMDIAVAGDVLYLLLAGGLVCTQRLSKVEGTGAKRAPADQRTEDGD